MEAADLAEDVGQLPVLGALDDANNTTIPMINVLCATGQKHNTADVAVCMSTPEPGVGLV